MPRILLNETRMEAVVLKDLDEYTMKSLTQGVKRYVKDWSFTDNIKIYETDFEISYYSLSGYNELNFQTYNKEVHPFCECFYRCNCECLEGCPKNYCSCEPHAKNCKCKDECNGCMH